MYTMCALKLMAVDRWPQWLNLTTAVQTVATDYIQSETSAPVRLASLEVMEILGVEWSFLGASMQGLDAEFANILRAHISKATRGSPAALNDPNVIDQMNIQLQTFFPEATETGGAGQSDQRVIYHDFSSSGKGFLSAATAFFLGIDQDSQAQNLMTVQARMLYKIVKVTANELVGLISQ